MSPPIELSLKGDGRLLRLTPRTVRTAFLQVVQVNQLMFENLRDFDDPDLKSPRYDSTPLDRLFCRTRKQDRFLGETEIRGIEHRLNKILLRDDLRLTEGEGIIQHGAAYAPGAGLQPKPCTHVIRYGIHFELTQITRDLLASQPAADVAVETASREVKLLRYIGTRCSTEGVCYEFANRFDLGVRHLIRLTHFDCRRLYRIRRVAACEGFRLVHIH